MRKAQPIKHKKAPRRHTRYGSDIFRTDSKSPGRNLRIPVADSARPRPINSKRSDMVTVNLL